MLIKLCFCDLDFTKCSIDKFFTNIMESDYIKSNDKLASKILEETISITSYLSEFYENILQLFRFMKNRNRIIIIHDIKDFCGKWDVNRYNKELKDKYDMCHKDSYNSIELLQFKNMITNFINFYNRETYNITRDKLLVNIIAEYTNNYFSIFLYYQIYI